MGAVVRSEQASYANDGATLTGTATTTNAYRWYDGAAAERTDIVSRNAGGQTTSAYNTTYAYTTAGVLTSARIADGRPRDVAVTSDVDGQALRRQESDASGATVGNPVERWYRFDGRELGMVGNNGTLETDYLTSQVNRTATPPAANASGGAFRDGYSSAVNDFARNDERITSFEQGAAGGGYTVQAGDTLAGIATRLWGDASLWYKLAQANGLAGDGGLVTGQRLSVPAGVLRIHNNADTFRPYDPGDAYGASSPTTPAPQAAAKKAGCGVFGKVVLAVVAIAVVALLRVPAFNLVGALGVSGGAAAVGGGALAAAAGSVASQSVGLATGLQDRFSWKGVALAAIGGGIGGAIAPGGAFGEAGAFAKAGAIGGGALRGVLGSTAIQGIAVATGLQSRFDWAGVAAAGAGGAAFGAAGGALGRTAGLAASGLANAASRSLLTGTDFGDNILAALPDVIAQTVGGLVAERIASGGGQGAGQRYATDWQSEGEGFDFGPGSPVRQADGASLNVEALRSAVAQVASGPEGFLDESDIYIDGGDVVVTASLHSLQDVRSLTDVEFGRIELEAQRGGWGPEAENAAIHHYAHNAGVLRMAAGGTSLALDLLPGIGGIKAGYQLSTGFDPLTGERSSPWANGIGVVASMLPGAALARKAFAGGVGRGVGVAAERGSSLPVVFDGELATQQLLGTTTTPGGRQIMFHAADRMVNPPPGRVSMTPAQIDEVLDGATHIVKYNHHPLGDTLTIRNMNMPGRPEVVVDAATGQRVITVIKNTKRQ